MPVFSLSHHAHYQCRHAGACCKAGWHIPVETLLQPRLGTAVIEPDATGTCSRYDEHEHRCRVHRDLGESSLPLACDQFPRVSLTDTRGTFIVLSHFCPTAAGMLFDSSDLRIVRDPVAFPASRRYDGLDASGAWAPLVRERLLFGLDDYTRWEIWMVETLASAATAPRALARIAHAAEQLRTWTPADGPFAAWLEHTCAESREDDELPRGLYDDLTSPDIVSEIPWRHGDISRPSQADRVAPPALPALPSCESALRRYLAGKAFASWCAYQGRGIRTTVAEIVVSHTVLLSELSTVISEAGHDADAAMFTRAVRAADWRLVHGLDRGEFTAWLGRVETR